MSHEFGLRLRSLRHEWGLHQRDLERALNLCQGACSQYERNLREPGFDLLISMGDFFDASLDYLLGRPEAVRESAAILAARRRLAALVERHPLHEVEPFRRLDHVLKLAAQAAPALFAVKRLARRLKVEEAVLLAAAEAGESAPRELASKLTEYLGISASAWEAHGEYLENRVSLRQHP